MLIDITLWYQGNCVYVGFALLTLKAPEHALLLCCGSRELIHLRCTFLSVMAGHLPLRGEINNDNACGCLKSIIQQQSTINLTAKFVHEVLAVFERVPLVRPRYADNDSTVVFN